MKPKLELPDRADGKLLVARFKELAATMTLDKVMKSNSLICLLRLAGCLLDADGVSVMNKSGLKLEDLLILFLQFLESNGFLSTNEPPVSVDESELSSVDAPSATVDDELSNPPQVEEESAPGWSAPDLESDPSHLVTGLLQDASFMENLASANSYGQLDRPPASFSHNSFALQQRDGQSFFVLLNRRGEGRLDEEETNGRSARQLATGSESGEGQVVFRRSVGRFDDEAETLNSSEADAEESSGDRVLDRADMDIADGDICMTSGDAGVFSLETRHVICDSLRKMASSLSSNVAIHDSVQDAGQVADPAVPQDVVHGMNEESSPGASHVPGLTANPDTDLAPPQEPPLDEHMTLRSNVLEQAPGLTAGQAFVEEANPQAGRVSQESGGQDEDEAEPEKPCLDELVAPKSGAFSLIHVVDPGQAFVEEANPQADRVSQASGGQDEGEAEPQEPSLDETYTGEAGLLVVASDVTSGDVEQAGAESPARDSAAASDSTPGQGDDAETFSMQEKTKDIDDSGAESPTETDRDDDGAESPSLQVMNATAAAANSDIYGITPFDNIESNGGSTDGANIDRVGDIEKVNESTAGASIHDDTSAPHRVEQNGESESHYESDSNGGCGSSQDGESSDGSDSSDTYDMDDGDRSDVHASGDVEAIDDVDAGVDMDVDDGAENMEAGAGNGAVEDGAVGKPVCCSCGQAVTVGRKPLKTKDADVTPRPRSHKRKRDVKDAQDIAKAIFAAAGDTSSLSAGQTLDRLVNHSGMQLDLPGGPTGFTDIDSKTVEERSQHHAELGRYRGHVNIITVLHQGKLFEMGRQDAGVHADMPRDGPLMKKVAKQGKMHAKQAFNYWRTYLYFQENPHHFLAIRNNSSLFERLDGVQIIFATRKELEGSKRSRK